jgi:hypothetical protein
MNTSKKTSNRFLAKRAEALLLEWVNIPANYPRNNQSGTEAGFTPAYEVLRSKFRDASARVVQRYPEVFSSLPYPIILPPHPTKKIHPVNWRILAKIREILVRAWDAPNQREREWYIFQARLEHHFFTVYYPMRDARVAIAVRAGADPDSESIRRTAEEEEVRISPPRVTPFEQVMYHFQRIADRARHCGNAECPAPYFFAIKKGQKYCSSKCSAPAQREQKREWWRTHRSKER